MGIPFYFKSIINDYNEILIPEDLFDKKINNLFFDLNCLIHPCCKDLDNEELIINNIYENIINIINIIKPINIVYIAIDGVCPRAKIQQQKYRRFKSANENKIWDTNAITPGTEFMNKLNIFLKENIEKKIILSDSNEFGEGEHKIFSYLKNNIKLSDTNIVYGLDSDLIMLSLLRNHNIYLFRERTEFNIENLESEYVYLDISLLKKYLIKDIKKPFINLPNQSIINDYIFLCFFIGNDFVHNLPSINIRYNGLTNLLNTYNILQQDNNGNYYLIKNNNIDLNNLKLFLKRLYEQETKHIKDILFIRGKQEKKYKHIYSDLYSKYIQDNNIINNNTLDIIDFKNQLPIIDRRDEENIFLDLRNWKDKYYYFNLYTNHKYNSTYKDVIVYEKKNICKNYLESLIWTTKYYFDECISWRWYYKYHFSPSVDDLNNYIQNIKNIDIIKKDNNVLSTSEQLLLVLPLKSINLNKNEKMDEYYYPNSFYTNTLLKRYHWEGHPILPE
jgi:5'-3' exonuclease